VISCKTYYIALPGKIMYRINPIRKNPHCNSKLLNPFLTLKPTPKSTSKDYKTTTGSQTKYQQKYYTIEMQEILTLVHCTFTVLLTLESFDGSSQERTSSKDPPPLAFEI
jgi:hypothetical protein